MLVDGHSVQSYVDVFAEARVVETKEDQRDVSRQRSKTKACRDAVRTDGIHTPTHLIDRVS